MRNKIGGGILIAVSVAVQLIVDRMDFALSNRLGIPLLIVCAATALIGLALSLSPETKVPPASLPVVQSPRSTTIIARGKGKVQLDDFYSTADTFANVEGEASVVAQRGLHDPARAPRRAVLWHIWPVKWRDPDRQNNRH